MENDDPEPEPSIAKKRTIPDKWYSFEDTEFYVPPDLRHLNPCKYAPHSRLLVNDLICILCQRVCNETYAVVSVFYFLFNFHIFNINFTIY